MSEKQKLLSMIRKYDFALCELQLYLDTHPNCSHATKLWQKYQSKRQQLASQYVQQFGPIQPIQTEGETPWSWTDGPWPWEKEAN